MAAPSLNTTLAGLADVVQPALAALYPGIAVLPYAPHVGPATVLPLGGIMPGTYVVEETFSGERGNRATTTQHGKGNSLYTVLYIQAPAGPTIGDTGPAQQALYDAVDAIIGAFTGRARRLPDAGGNARALDAGPTIIAHFPAQGPPISYRNQLYVGAYITVEVWELERP